MDENPIPNMQYPPGIRFRPSDEELITYYLQRKVNSLPLPANVIADVELYSYDPWDLPSKALSGEDEWYFFTPRDKKYPNGGRPNRTAASGYWKAIGADKIISSSSRSMRIGVKKDLVFYKGKPPKGLKVDWIMTEYRLPDTCRPSRSKWTMRLDDWVLCRIRQKGNMSKNIQGDNANSCENLVYLLKNEDLQSPEDKSRDMLANYLLSNDYNLMASLLLGNDPGFVSLPTSIFQNSSSSNNCGTILEQQSGTINTQAKCYWPDSHSSVNSLPGKTKGKDRSISFFNSLPSQIEEDNRPNSFFYSLPSQIVHTPTNMIMYKQTDSVTVGTNLYCQSISEDKKLETNDSSNTCISFQELDMQALSKSSIQ